MIRNLLVLLGLVLMFVWGMAAYHLRSVQRLADQPLSVAYWEDRGGAATVANAIRATAYAPLRQRRFNVGYTESIYWVRVQIEADSKARELTLEVRNHTIDRLEVFAVTGQRVESLGQTGSRFPFSQRPSPTRTFAYPLRIEAGQPVELYCRMDKRYENLSTELVLWQTDDFEDREQREYFLWGIFVGVVGLIVLLAFLFYAATRDPAERDPVYAWYGLYVLALTIRQLTDVGLGFQFLWPAVPGFNQPDPLIEVLWLYLFAVLQFQQSFLALREVNPRLFRVNQVLSRLYLALFMGLVLAQLMGFTEQNTHLYRLVRLVHLGLTSATILLFVRICKIALTSSDQVKQLYGAGLLLQTLGNIVVMIQHLSSTRPNPVLWVDNYLIILVNFFIDLVIFSFLLAYRYRKSADEQRQLQLRLAQTGQQTNEAIIDVLESERQQVGTLLRTDVGGRLAQTRTLLSAVPPAPLLTETRRLLDKTDDCLDQILRDNLPPDLLQKGLATALSELVDERNRTGTVRLSLRTGPESGWPQDGFSAAQTRQLYRMTNELLNNLIKHARATEGEVVLHQSPAGWQLVVSDNGRGFDLAQAQRNEGIGLRNLYARAQTLGATVQIQSGGDGTRVVVYSSPGPSPLGRGGISESAAP